MRRIQPSRIRLFISLILLLPSFLLAQNKKVLHYSETSGFDHQTRISSFNMFNSFGGVNVTHDINGSEFNLLSNLLSYDLIIFSNTSGNNLLDSIQKSHFEIYIQNGGNLLGIHAATDTYRHSSSNGTSKGNWDFYAETIGGSVQQNPNHVSGVPFYNMNIQNNHPSILGIPNPWGKNEEYYYWENGYLDSNITIILEVEQTIGPNNQVNSYDSARAVSWFKNLNSGSRVFYTSLGHLNSNFNSDTLFQKHIEQAMNWCLGITTGLSRKFKEENPFVISVLSENQIAVQVDQPGGLLEIFDAKGRNMMRSTIKSHNQLINLNHGSGVYLIRYRLNQISKSKKISIY